jgi:hypothetical protein
MRAYRSVVAYFFEFVGAKYQADVVPANILAWRDHLHHSRKRAATVCFKLSVFRYFFTQTDCNRNPRVLL